MRRPWRERLPAGPPRGIASILRQTILSAHWCQASQLAVAFEGVRDRGRIPDQESIVGHHFCRERDSYVLDPDASYLFAFSDPADLQDPVQACSDISGGAEAAVLGIS